ncbi:MAG TPA: hypothetical protein VF156_11460 [Agromyces sp.]
MTSTDPHLAPEATTRHARLAEALRRELYALRTLRAEVEAMQPGLLPERIDGWHAGAAEYYAERVRDVRLGIAGAQHLLADAERAVAVALEGSRAGGGWP